MAQPGTRSLDVVVAEVQRERETQLRHFDALDSKAGVMLGFAGALAALAPAAFNAMVDMGRAVAVAGAVAALWAFWPRRYGAIEVRALRDRYVAAEPEFTRLRLLDTQIATIDELAKTLYRKARRLKLSMSLVVVAALLIVAGTVLH
jgi:undecaprenyl pyrophosphate phosphatase UppP